jgi:dihydropteroate synthase
MGIINVTPDSFSGDGLICGDQWVEQAIAQGQRFAQEGAHILDVGGESTRPGAEPVAAETEMQRVLPVITALAAEVDLPISVDTYKADVAAAALDAGAHMVNDVWGLRMDPDLAKLCADRQVPVVLMHNRSHPRNAVQEARLGGRYLGTEYDDLLTNVADELQRSIDLAKAAGIPDDNIIIDPGIGFGKTVEQNLTLLNHLDAFESLGYPILLGTSNKSLVGYTLDLPADDRVEGTAATIAIGIDRGADIIRVHQVKSMSRVARMTDAIVRV